MDMEPFWFSLLILRLTLVVLLVDM
jgi:hypothetical protein